MAEHNKKGFEGEEIAAEFLRGKGYIILEKNWRFRHFEADIIARRNNTIVVAEVKTRGSNFFGEPEEFVTRKKQKHLVETANAYVQKNNLEDEVRFDIISILLGKGGMRINHIEDAFYPTL